MISPTAIGSPIRVLLIGNDKIVHLGLHNLLESQPGLKVAGQADSQADALNALRARPDIILLDINFSADVSLGLLQTLMENSKGTRVLILTGLRDTEVHLRSIRMGAMGVALKNSPVELLVEAIKQVHAGEVWLDRSIMSGIIGEMLRSSKPKQVPAEVVAEANKISALTGREREVIALLAEGLKNKRIAERMFISEATVHHHLTSIFDKLGVSDQLELVVYAYRHGLAKLPF